MSKFTDALRLPWSARGDSPVKKTNAMLREMKQAADIIDELETALRDLIDVTPQESPLYSVTEFEFETAKNAAADTLAKLESMK